MFPGDAKTAQIRETQPAADHACLTTSWTADSAAQCKFPTANIGVEQDVPVTVFVDEPVLDNRRCI